MFTYSTFQENVCSAPTELNGQKGHIFLKGTVQAYLDFANIFDDSQPYKEEGSPIQGKQSEWNG